MTLWNPTVHTINHHVRVPVTKSYNVRDPTGRAILAEVRIYEGLMRSLLS